MSTVADLRNGLVTALSFVPDLNTYSAEPGQLTPPAAVVLTPTIEYHRSFNSTDALKQYDFRIYVLVAQGLLDEAAHTLDTFADPTSTWSIRAALEADTTLGGVCESLIVTSFRPLNAEEVASLQYWGGSFDVTVFAR